METTRAAYTQAFDEELHPRNPKGADTGGQFTAAKKGSTKPASKPAAKSPDLFYDPKTNQGTGYNMAGGDPRVKKLQDALNRLHLTDGSGKPLKVDGKLGPKTTAAVKKAQKRLGLTPDGRVTPALLAKLAGAKNLPGRARAMDLCTRSYDFEYRGEAGDGLTLEGYAAVFNTPTRIRDHVGDFDEVVLPGAFARSLTEHSPVLQWDHGRDPAVGTAPIGDITDLREDEHGLFVRARLYDHPSTERVRMAIKGRSVKGMSFRFGVPDKGDTWSTRTGEPDLREIREADVHELGPVAFPAYKSTSVGLRHLLADLSPEERADLIRDLAAELRNVPDLTDFVGRPGTRSSGGDEHGTTTSGDVTAPIPHLRQRLDDGALRIRGILL